MHNLIVSFLLASLLLNCNKKDCNTLPNSFPSYTNALKAIQSTEFRYEDNTDTSDSSWITSANYYSCDYETGFLLIAIKSKTYIHKAVPRNIWNKFKEASSKGKFYNSYVKSHYKLRLN